LNKVKK